MFSRTPSPACCGKNDVQFARERRHYATAARLRRRSTSSTSASFYSNSDTRAEFINRAFRNGACKFAPRRTRPTSSGPSSRGGIENRPQTPAHLRTAGGSDALTAFIARRTEMIRSGDSTPINIKLAERQGAALQLHGIAGRRTDAELYAGHRPRPPYRRSRQGRILPVAARQRNRALAGIARGGIEAAPHQAPNGIDPSGPYP